MSSPPIQEPQRASPYQGLIPYDEGDASYFFGRGKDTRLIIANLFAAPLTLLYGASGVGKTSVLRAGVAHQLSQRDDLLVVVFNAWHGNPVSGLKSTVAEAVSRALAESVPLSNPGPLSEFLGLCAERLDRRLMIILDQFEEYFLYHSQDETFDFEFSKVVAQHSLPVSFLISLREDSYAKLDRFEGRIPTLYNNYLRLEHLDRHSASEAIINPIEHYNRLLTEQESPINIEPMLVDNVIEQVKAGQVFIGEVGRGQVAPATRADIRVETPYLQLVMTRLWDEEMRTGSHSLRLETLNRLGGSEQIVHTHLDDALNKLPAIEQGIAADLFRYLVTPSGTKIANSISDLAELSRRPEDEVNSVIEELASSDTRVLRAVAPPLDQPNVHRYEIFHDVLAPAILEWRNRYARRQERAEAQKQLALERRRVITLGLGLIGLSLLLIAMVGLAVYALQQRDAAINAQNIALSREIASTAVSLLGTDPELSLLLAGRATRIQDTPQAIDILRMSMLESHVRVTFRGHTDRLNVAIFSPDGKLAVTTGWDKTARVWDVNTGSTLVELKGHTSAVLNATFSPDGKFLVTSGADGSVWVWDSTSWKSVAELRGHTSWVNSAQFSPDGQLLATASGDNAAIVWDTNTWRIVSELRGHTDQVTLATFSPDGKQVLTASTDKTARVWNARTGANIFVLRGHTDAVPIALFSPDGSKIVTASWDKTARIWNSKTGESILELKGHEGFVNTALFSPDGKLIVTASGDNTARVWDSEKGTVLIELRGPNSPFNSAQFSPDGRSVLTVSEDHKLRIWDWQNGQTIAEFIGHTDKVSSALFSPDGKELLTASWDRTARLWDVPPGRGEVRLLGHSDKLTNVTFSPNSELVATASEDGTARIWKTSGDKFAELTGHNGVVLGASFSPDGKWIVTYGTDAILRVWDIATGRIVSELRGHLGIVSTAMFSSDSRLIVSASDDKTARIWEAKTGKSMFELSGHTDRVTSASFSLDDKLVVTSSDDKTARLWDVSTGKSIRELLGHTDRVNNAAFSPNAKLVVTASADNTARVWDVNTGMSHELIGHKDQVTSAVFDPDGESIATASRDKSARIWELKSGRSIELQGHTSWVNTVAYSPNGEWLVTASDDGTARVWESSTGREMILFPRSQASVDRAVFSPSGKWIATANGDNTGYIYICDICGSVEELLKLGDTRVTRNLSCEEQRIYVHETSSCSNISTSK